MSQKLDPTPEEQSASVQSDESTASPSSSQKTSATAPAPSQKDVEKVTRMGTALLPQLITEFAIPAVAGMLVNGSYNIVDSIFLGHAVGELGLSAMTVANPIMIVFMALSMLVGAGGNALAAIKLGEGDRSAAETSLGNVVTMCIIMWFGLIFVALCPGVLDGLLTLSSATDEVRPYARDFIRILCLGSIIQSVGFGVNNFIRTAGAPNRALLSMIIGIGGATVFNYLFVIVGGMGVVGSAYATLAGQSLSFIYVLWYFTLAKNVPFHLRLSCMRPIPSVMGTILAYGFPSFVTQGGMALCNFVLNAQLVYYGALSPIGADDALASIGVVQRIGMFTAMPLVGISVALQPLLGYNYGARKFARVRTALWLGIAGATVFGFVEWLIIMIFPTEVASAFGISHDGLLEFTAFALKVQFAMLPFIGFQIVGANYFQATGQPKKSIFLTLTRQILFLIPLLYIMPPILPSLVPGLNGLDALYFAAPVADFLSIFTVGVFIIWEMRRLRKLIAPSSEPKDASNLK